MSYWWVNQSQSWEQKRAGGYMWAPLRDQAGHTLGHWETMAEVRPGDIVFHYAHGAVRAVSTVTRRAESAPMPSELPERWEREGRLVRVAMTDASPPVALADIDLDARLGEAGGPFNRLGKVKQAYLFPISAAFGRALLERIGAEVASVDDEVETVLIEDDLVSPGLPGKELREAIERYAVNEVMRLLAIEHPECRIAEISRTNPGYDIEVRCSDSKRYVEVKGTMAHGPVFVLSERERRFSSDNADSYEILVVWGIDLDAQSHHAVSRLAGEVRPESHGLTPWKWQGRLP